jgi:hypothetical protein
MNELTFRWRHIFLQALKLDTYIATHESDGQTQGQMDTAVNNLIRCQSLEISEPNYHYRLVISIPHEIETLVPFVKSIQFEKKSEY